MKLIINGVDIASDKDVRITQCYSYTYADGLSDTLVVECGDPEGLWASWGLRPGDTIAAEGNDGFASGEMYVTKITRSNQKIRITGRSVPPGRITTKYKIWKDVRFDEIGAEVAGELGLSYLNFGVENVYYDDLIQDNETGVGFFYHLCLFESASLLVFDGQLVAYDKALMESEAVDSLSFSVDGIYEITDSIADEYGSCRIHWTEKPSFEEERFIRFVSKDLKPIKKNEEASADLPGLSLDKTKPEYIPPDNEWYRGQFYPEKVEFEGTAQADSISGSEFYTDQIRVTSDDQAARWAKGLLRYKNEKRISGSFTKPLLGQYSAGIVVSLSFTMSPDLDGNYFIDHIFHDYKANRSTAYVHKCLGW